MVWTCMTFQPNFQSIIAQVMKHSFPNFRSDYSLSRTTGEGTGGTRGHGKWAESRGNTSTEALRGCSLPPAQRATRWGTTLSSKVNLPHAIEFTALCGATLVSNSTESGLNKASCSNVWSVTFQPNRASGQTGPPQDGGGLWLPGN